jgi:tRNA A-37 threonylcarbamoyl transferase component Bud32
MVYWIFKFLMKINLDGIHWHYTSDDGPDWLSEISSSPDVDIVKKTSHHGVYRHTGGVFLKIFHYPFYRSFRSRNSAKACKEGKNVLALQQFGIRTPKVLAFGEERKHGRLIRDVLITKELTSIMPLPGFITIQSPDLSFNRKKKVIGQFAFLIKKLHDSGIYHRDINFGNLFIEKSDSEFGFAMLDVDKVIFYSKSLPESKRIRNIGDLLQMFWVLSNTSQRFFFLGDYTGQRKPDITFIQKIEKYVHQSNFKRGLERSRKSLTHSSSFFVKKIENGTIHGLNHPDANTVMATYLRDPDIIQNKMPEDPAGKKPSATEILLDGKQYILKRYPPSPCCSFCRSRPGKATPAREWCNTWGGFITRRLPIVKPLIYFRAKPESRENPSHIIFECDKRMKPLSTVWLGLSRDNKRRILIRLGILIGYMHRTGCMHGNLLWENIMVDLSARTPVINFQNIEKSAIYPNLSPETAIKDLDVFLNQLEIYEPCEANRFLFRKTYEKRAGIVSMS